MAGIDSKYLHKAGKNTKYLHKKDRNSKYLHRTRRNSKHIRQEILTQDRQKKILMLVLDKRKFQITYKSRTKFQKHKKEIPNTYKRYSEQ